MPIPMALNEPILLGHYRLLPVSGTPGNTDMKSTAESCEPMLATTM